MLIVRRRPGESIVIADLVEVEVLEVSGTQVKLGITAPREIPVIRREILITSRENQIAADLETVGSLDRLLELLK